jgi:hypothetical protein
MEDLNQVKIQSKKELQQLRNAAQVERTKLTKEIASLQSQVRSIDAQLELGRQEISKMEQDSLSAIYRLEIAKKEQNVERLKEQGEIMRLDMDQMKIQLAELQVALDKSQVEGSKAQDTMKDLERERLKDQNLISKIKAQLIKEKENFEQQFAQFAIDIQNVKDESQTQIKESNMKSNQLETELMTEIEGTETNILDEEKKLKGKRDELYKVKRQTRLEINRKRKESRRRQRDAKGEANRQKKERRSVVWDLDSQLDAAKYAYIISLRDTKVYRKALTGFELQMSDLVELHAEEITSIEQKLLAEEMFFAKSQFDTRLRTVTLVEKLQRRFRRQEEKAKLNAEKRKEANKIKLTSEFDTSTQTILRKREELLLEKAKGLAADKERAAKEMARAKADFDAKVINVNNDMDAAKQETRQQMETLKLAFDEEMAQLQAKGDDEKQAIVDSKNSVIRKIKLENQQEEDVLKTEMKQRINKASGQQSYLENEVKIKKGQIEEYESERKSIRALTRMTLKLTRKKITRRN